MYTQTVIRRVRKMFDLRNHRFNCKNIYLYDSFEADVVSVDRHDRVHEVEIKMSRSDFLADFKKEGKHHKTSNGYMANFFYFACPAGLVDKEDIPEYAGLIWVDDRLRAWIRKPAPELHTNGISTEHLMKISEKMHHTKR